MKKRKEKRKEALFNLVWKVRNIVILNKGKT